MHRYLKYVVTIDYIKKVERSRIKTKYKVDI